MLGGGCLAVGGEQKGGGAKGVLDCFCVVAGFTPAKVGGGF